MSPDPLPEVVAYADGACRGNPGPGGYGVVLMTGPNRKELSGGFRKTTNNRMELLAAIRALQALKMKCRVVLHTDSKYLVDGINDGWARRWRSKNWWISANKRAKNSDLWAELLTLMEGHDCTIEWVKGHAGVEGNERTDQLAETAATGQELPPDEGYERLQAQPESSCISPGQPCFKCGTPVVRREGRAQIRPGQTSYFEWFLFCPACHSSYMVEAARRLVDAPSERLL